MKGHPKHPQGKSILGRRIFSYFVPAGVIFAALTVGAAILAGLGNRWMWWDFRTGLVILSSAAHCGLIAAAISLVGWILSQQRDSRRGIVFAIIGFLLGLAAFGIPWSWYRIAQRVPAIHDVTTDTENPPSFVAILKVRKGAPNPAE
jgi:MFS family permease